MVLPLKYACITAVPLETGVAVIARIYLILSSISLVVSIASFLFLLVVSMGVLKDPDFKDINDIVNAGIGVIIVVFLIIFLVIGTITLLHYRLLKATEERRPGPVLTWAVFFTMYTVLFFITFIAVDDSVNLISVITGVINVYVLMVVYSYYIELKQLSNTSYGNC